MANGLIPDLPRGISQAEFDVAAGPDLRAMDQPSGRERFGNALMRFGAGFNNPNAHMQQLQKQREAKQVALQLSLQALPEGDIRRDQLAAQLDNLLGLQGVGAAIRSGPTTLSAGQRIVQQGAGGEFEQLVDPVFAPSAAGRKTETQRGIDELLQRNFSLNDAQDIQRGRVVPTSPDAFGNVYLLNRATGESKLAVRGGGASLPEPAGEGQARATKKPRAGLAPIAAAGSGIGPQARLKQMASDVIGPFVKGALFEDTVQARQRLGLFNKIMERSLVNNPRFPLGEMSRVGELLPNTQKFFTDPDAARNDLVQTRDFLKSWVSIKKSEMKAPAVTSKRKAQLADQISTVRENLALFGPLPSEDFSGMSVDQLITVDPAELSPEQLQTYIENLEQGLQ